MAFLLESGMPSLIPSQNRCTILLAEMGSLISSIG